MGSIRWAPEMPQGVSRFAVYRAESRILAGALLVAGLVLPWGTLSVGLLGSPTVEVGTVNGRQIGSDILSLPVGLDHGRSRGLGIIGLAIRSAGTIRAAGIIAVLVTGYALVAIRGKEFTTTVNGQDISSAFNGQVGYASGLFVLVGAAITLSSQASSSGRTMMSAFD